MFLQEISLVISDLWFDTEWGGGDATDAMTHDESDADEDDGYAGDGVMWY